MKVCASLHAGDTLSLGQEIAAVAPFVASLHVDVMDGQFAPAFGFGERLVAALSRAFDLPIDVHLMVANPERWVGRFAALGARRIAFHVEACPDVRAIVRTIRDAGSLAYLALLPDTPLESASALLSAADGVLLLTAPPGGGRFQPSALARIHGLPSDVPSIVDGGIGLKHFDDLRAADVELAVVGRALFDDEDLPARAREFGLAASR
jgi:ribulose-phosphate 3-epimerase